MRTPLEIAIIGGGIGGLSAALALTRAGHIVTIYEQAAAVKPMGTSLTLWPNAMTCLSDLGVADSIVGKGALIAKFAARNINTSPYFEVDMAHIYKAFGAPGICIRRSDLQNILMNALPCEHIKLNHRLSGLTQGTGVELTFENGNTAQADLVIGADGLNSTVREMIFNDGPANYAGYGAWLGIADHIPKSMRPDEACEYYGPKGRLGIAPTDANSAYWYYVENAKQPRQAAGPCDVTGLRETLEDWPEYAHQLFDATPSGSFVYAPFYDRPSSKHWGKQRALLLGDAIHPFTPNLGQGGCQAIEDAYALGVLTGRDLSADAILPAYQKARAKRAAMFARQSRQIGQITQMTTPGLRGLRSFVLKTASAARWEKQLRAHFTRPVF